MIHKFRLRGFVTELIKNGETTGNYYLAVGEEKIKANQLLDHLENVVAEYNGQAFEYHPFPEIQKGDVVTITIEVKRKEIKK
jgi:hypothetical protein